MLAAVFHALGDADVLRVEDIPTPEPDTDEVLVRVRAAAVNPKDTFIRKGRFAHWTGTDFPMQVGFDFAGEIVSAGSEVRDAEQGAPVFGMLDGWAGRSCAQYLTVKPFQIYRKPGNLDFEEAAALPLVSLTALQALRNEAGIRPGAQVCINGASGGVGSMAIQMAKIFDASVTAVSSAGAHPHLQRLGADACIDYQQSDITRSSRRFDIFFDVFGNRLFESVRPILKPEGVWVSTVLKPEVFTAVEQTRDTPGQKARLVIVRADRDDLSKICRWAESGRLTPVIHEIFPLERIADAHRQQETKHTHGKLVIKLP